uniref:Putative ovule protein n=1 Tax=Solanum chacoense TaxID=4108 RepID=A0A0V0GK14_SOLCH
MLKQTLVGTGALLVAAVSLFIFATPVEDFFRDTFTTKENSLSSTSTNSTNKLGIRYSIQNLRSTIL